MSAGNSKEKVEIKTHKIPGSKDPYKTWRREKPVEVVSNPQDVPAEDWLPPVKPASVHRQERIEAQLKAGVGTHASRTAAGMDEAEKRAEMAEDGAGKGSSGD